MQKSKVVKFLSNTFLVMIKYSGEILLFDTFFTLYTKCWQWGWRSEKSKEGGGLMAERSTAIDNSRSICNQHEVIHTMLQATTVGAKNVWVS